MFTLNVETICYLEQLVENIREDLNKLRTGGQTLPGLRSSQSKDIQGKFKSNEKLRIKVVQYVSYIAFCVYSLDVQKSILNKYIINSIEEFFLNASWISLGRYKYIIISYIYIILYLIKLFLFCSSF